MAKSFKQAIKEMVLVRGLGPFCVAFACPPCVSVVSLQFLPQSKSHPEGRLQMRWDLGRRRAVLNPGGLYLFTLIYSPPPHLLHHVSVRCSPTVAALTGFISVACHGDTRRRPLGRI